MKRLLISIVVAISLSGCGFRFMVLDGEYDRDTGNVGAGEISLEVDGDAPVETPE